MTEKAEHLLTLSEKLQALAKLAEQGRDGDVYAGIEFLLRTREWPEWLKDVAAAIDAPRQSGEQS